jgi:hypothetical protein
MAKYAKTKRDDYGGQWTIEIDGDPKKLYREANMGDRVWTGSEAEADELLAEIAPPKAAAAEAGKGK